MNDCRRARQAILDLLGHELLPERSGWLLAHIDRCARCKQEYIATERALRSLHEAPATLLPDEEYWTRYQFALRQRLETGDDATNDHGRSRFAWTWFAAAAAAALFAGVILLNQPGPPMNRPAIVDAVRVAHMEQVDLLCRDVANSGELPVSDHERRRARNILADNYVLRLQAEIRGDKAAAYRLEQLEPILLDVAHFPEDHTAREWNALQERIRRQRWSLDAPGPGEAGRR